VGVSGLAKLAPVVLFVFSRVEHTARTIESLQQNELASQTEVFVYSDAARDNVEQPRVNQVRALIREIRGFKKVTIVERKANYGLARNIVEGVTEIVTSYGSVIVLEDDLVVSRMFLSFMNEALERYRDEPKVWHVSGWNYPIGHEGLGDAFFWRIMNCWGWATWKDRWKQFRKDTEHLLTEWSREEIEKFNLDGAYRFWRQVEYNHGGEIDTWGVFWYATIFESKGLCLNPTFSLVRNIGHDGTGEYCGRRDVYGRRVAATLPSAWPENIVENQTALRRVKRFYSRKRLPLVGPWLAKLNVRKNG